MKEIGSATLICLTLGSTSAFAGLEGFEINGFLSIAAAWADVDFLPSGIEPVYDSFIRTRPSFDEDSNVGIQITKQLNEELSLTTQLLAEASNDWFVEAVWAFLKWEPSACWQFRVGRVRTEPYMLSETVNVAYTYPWVRPPEEVYSQVPSEFTNQTGVDLRYKRVFCEEYDLVLRAFYGATTRHVFVPAGIVFPFGIDTTLVDRIRVLLRDVYAFSLKYGNKIFSVRAGYQSASLTLDPNAGSADESVNAVLNVMALGVPGVVPAIGLDWVNYFSVFHSRISFMGLGYQVDWKNFVSMGEIVKRKNTSPIIANTIGWYLMGGYRISQFLPHITFARERLEDNKVRRFGGLINAGFVTLTGSSLTLDQIAAINISSMPDLHGGAGSQSSVTIGLRWDIYEGIAIKGEYKHIHPDLHTPGLFNVEPAGSVNLYSIAVDALM